jgi:hypothetical protein
MMDGTWLTSACSLLPKGARQQYLGNVQHTGWADFANKVIFQSPEIFSKICRVFKKGRLT